MQHTPATARAINGIARFMRLVISLQFAAPSDGIKSVSRYLQSAQVAAVDGQAAFSSRNVGEEVLDCILKVDK